MKASLRVFSFSLLATAAAIATTAQAPTSNQPPAQQPGAANSSVWSAPPTVGAVSTTPSACGNQPLCYDTPDFAAAVVDFRMSLTNGTKVMDVTMRFLNKTNQPLILGYLDGSAISLDDQGNRYGTYYNKGLAGIGVVAGNSMDPKFTLQPGGAGDARFELYWRPGAQDPIGSTFEFDANIREINTLVGGQHTLGGEFPLRFQGLMNGMNGAAPSGVAAAPGVSGVPAAAGANPMLATAGGASMPVCGSNGSASGAINAVAGAANSVGGQQAGNATSAASAQAGSVAAQFSSLKSLFGKKNAAAPAATTAGAPCVPAGAATASAPAATTPSQAAAPAQVVNTSATAANGKAPAAAAPATTQKTPANPAAMKAGAPVTARTSATPAPAGSAPAANATVAPKPATPATATTNTKTAPAAKPATNVAPKKPATTTTTPTPAQQAAQQPK